MPKRKPRDLHIPASADTAFKTEITIDWVIENAGHSLNAWKKLDIDNYILVVVRGKDPKDVNRVGFMVTSWEDLQPGDTINVMGKTLVVQKENE